MKTEANINFGKQVATLRVKAGLSQEKLALECGFDRTYIGTVERGEKSATINSIVKIARGLNVSLKELFDYETK
jgi:transcriptional regulator with XRE-family HTH domain